MKVVELQNALKNLRPYHEEGSFVVYGSSVSMAIGELIQVCAA